MALVTVSDRAVIEGHITMPRVGAWHCDMLLDVGQTINKPITINFFDGTQFFGTIIRQAVFANHLRIRAVGGAGALYNTEVQPKHWKYGPIPLSLPLQYILDEAGETLSNKTDQSLLNTQLVSWTCIPQSGSAAVRSLIEGYANAWRVLPDGTIWAGTEPWPNVDGKFNYVVQHKRTDIGVMEIAEDTSSLRPGTQFQDVRISRVDNYISQEGFRTLAHYFEAPAK